MVTKKTEDKLPEQQDADALEMVLKHFKRSWEYAQGSWHKRWEDNYRLYNNQRIAIGYVGISNVFVPMTCSTVDTLTSGLYGAKPTFDYVPPKEQEDQKTDILNAQLDEWWDEDQWSLKVPETGKFKFMLGTAIDYWAWCIDHPELIHVPIRDFFIDPAATTLENAAYMGRRYITTKAELEEFEIVDPETGDMVKKYHNLEHVNDYKSPDNTDKEEKDMWYGTVVQPSDDQVECIEYWTNDRVIVVANRCTVIENTENYFKARARKLGDENARGICPFADDRDITDLSLYYAKSTVDTIAGQQEQLNDLTNQLSDALTYTINQQYTIDPSVAHLQGQVKNMPGATFVAAKDAISPIVRGTIPGEAFAQIQNIKNEIRETTGVNEIIKGAPSEGSKATATEINAQVANAGQRISLKVTQLENGYFHRMGMIMFAFMRLYITSKKKVRVSGKDGVEYKEFDPELFKSGVYKPRVQLDITVEGKKKEQAEMAKEMLAAFLNDPDVNQVWLKKKTLTAGYDLEPDEVAEAFEPNPTPEQPPTAPDMGAGMAMDTGMMPPTDPMMGGAPQDPMAMLESLPPEVLDNLPPDVTEEELMQLIQANMAEQQPVMA